MATGDKIEGSTFRSMFSKIENTRAIHATSGGKNDSSIRTKLQSLVVPTDSPETSSIISQTTITSLKTALRGLAASYYINDTSGNISSPSVGDMVTQTYLDVVQLNVNAEADVCAHDTAHWATDYSNDGNFAFHESFHSSNDGHDGSFRMSYGSYLGSDTGTCSTYRSGGR